VHPRLNLTGRIGRWSARHRKTAILGWLAFVFLSLAVGFQVTQKETAQSDLGNGESRTAQRAVEDAGFPDTADEQVIVQAPSRGHRGDPAFRSAVRDVTARLAAVPHVGDVKGPYGPGSAGQVSRDGRSVLVSFKVHGDEDQVKERVKPTVAITHAVQRAHPEVRVEQFGGASSDAALKASEADDLHQSEMISVPITIVLLLLAFGSLVAAGLPLLLGLTAVAATMGLIGPLSHVAPVAGPAAAVVLLIGLAVGVDYSMFYLRREMEERDAGKGPEEAVVAAASTSGKAVLVSGLTVIIAMAGMFLAGNLTFVSFATCTIAVVAVAVAGSLTFLPAMLTWLGRKGWTEKGRVPILGRRRHETRNTSRVWGWVLDRVLRRPLVSAVASAAVLVALALPALGMHTITSGLEALPNDIPVVKTYDRIQTAFPGGPQPAIVVVQADDVRTPAVAKAIEELQSQALATGEVSRPTGVDINPGHDLAMVSLPLRGTGTDAASNAALATLHDDIVPRTVGAVDGATVSVGGITAGSKDFNDSMAAHLPIVFAFVLGLAFLLLLVTFRSLVIPIKAIVLNLLSVGAAYGVLKLVFQDGHGERLLGFHSLGGIASWLPLFLFVVLFGLSMDYHVFILSRIREAFDRGMSTDDAVAHGIRSTAGVVTAAASVMVAVFAVFATQGSMDLKEMGVGLAVAVLLDATLVRGVLLPATMKLLGDWNWYLPKGLQWLPKIGREPQAVPA
jgi:RND superfamily putative drug exporter